MDVLDLVDKLEAMALQAKKVPITGRAMIDAERLVELIDQIRLTIPRNIHEAREVMDRREHIVNQTMSDARRIRLTAESDARALVDESELVKSAKRRGDDVVAEAEAKAQRIMTNAENDARQRRAGADQYCQDSLHNLETQVVTLLNTIHTGQRILSPEDELVAAR